MKIKPVNSILFLFTMLFLVFCQEPRVTDEQPTLIAVSKKGSPKRFASYDRWIKSVDSTVVLIDMYALSLDSAIVVFQNCSGLLLTGGTDVYPGIYGKEGDTARCEEPDFKRDSLELMLIGLALEKKLPVLGICRGHQIINVGLGGTLIIDIPTDIGTNVSHREEGFNCYHTIRILPGTLLHEITGVDSGIVNSAHHQAVEYQGAGLSGYAYSDDGIIEAIGYNAGDREHFLLGVQWHPEHLDYTNPLSGKIAERFLKEVEKSGDKSRNN